MAKFLLSISLFIGFNFSLLGQDKKQEIRSFQLENYLKKTNSSEELVSLFVKGNKQEIEQQLLKQKGKLKGSIKDWIFIQLPSNQITTFIDKTSLSAINFRNYKGTPLNDTMRVNNRINAIHSGQLPLNTSYDGEGVIMGFIDTGLDWTHPDFLNPEDSSTRVLALWDQTKPVNLFTPSKYGYGQDWNSLEIMQGLSTNNDQFGHGTTVTGTGAGNGFANGLNKGVAPKTEIIAVESNFNAPNWLGTVVDAVEYIYQIADSLNKPCVINASLGTYIGSHDGLDPYALYIDSLINRRKGHLFVASAGNSGNWGNYHLHSSVTNDTAFTWFSYNPSSGVGGPAVFFEVWADTADFNQLEFAMGVDQVSPQFNHRGKGNYFNINTNLGGVNHDTIKNSNNETLATVQYYSELRDGQYLLQVYLPAPDSSQYNFRFETVGSGKYDVWSTSILGMSNMIDDISGVTSFTESHKYRLPDSLKTIVSSFQCSPYVVTVGNYTNDSGFVNVDSVWIPTGGTRGKLAVNSSKGPTRDNRLKPEIAASGDATQSAIPQHTIDFYQNHPTLDTTLALGGLHRRNGGTSMSSPVVAGVGALLLEKCHKMSVEEFISALTNNAYSDSYTGGLPNYGFGYGKLDGFKTLTNFSFTNILAGTLEFCEGDSNLITISNDVIDYNWNDSETNNSITVSTSAEYFLITTDSLGCKSDTLYFETVANSNPNSPILFTNFDSIIATGTNNHQIEWFYNSITLNDEIDSTLFVEQNGSYFLTVTNQNGCKSNSDTIHFNTVSVNESSLSNKLNLFPNPVKESLTVQSQQPIIAIELYDLSGKLIHTRENINQFNLTINTSKLATGGYYLKLSTSKTYDVKKIVIQH